VIDTVRTTCLLLAAAAAAACNGSGSGSGAAPAAAAATRTVASPGGIWHALGGAEDSLSLMVAESGDLKLYGAGPAFGSGAVVVTDADRLAGSFDVRALAAGPAAADAAAIEHCEFEGTVVERVAMHIELECTGSDGATRSESRTLLYDERYARGSSLDEIAGNYTLPFDRHANALSINNDGVMFGVYDNGPRCMVNGAVAPVDRRFNLYRFEWMLAGCGAAHARFEGAVLTGLGFLNPPGRPRGTLLLLLTGTVDARFEFMSLIYEPA
jgi:hypothetical protein